MSGRLCCLPSTSADESVCRPNFGCNVCAQEIEGVRFTCLPCSLAQNTSVDFCDKPGCRDATLDIDGSTHLPSHHMIKVRTFLFYDRDTPKLFGNATRVIADLTEQAKKMGTRPKLPAADARNDQGQDGDTGLVDGAGGALQAKDSVDAETPVTSPVDIKKDEPETRGRATAASANKVTSVRPTCVSCSAKMEPPFFVCVDCIGESLYASFGYEQSITQNLGDVVQRVSISARIATSNSAASLLVHIRLHIPCSGTRAPARQTEPQAPPKSDFVHWSRRWLLSLGSSQH